MANVVFDEPAVARKTFANSLKINDNFRIATSRSRGAVYRVVEDLHGETLMLEEATGRILPLTLSPVEQVDVTVTVRSKKPSIY